MVEPHVKRLRVNMTDAERKLWRALRARSINAKFRRQVPLGPYIVDFVAFEEKLIVEVDGGQHSTSATDGQRDRYFSERGYRTLRFWNSDVMANLDGVIQRIAAVTNPSPGALLRNAPPSPSRGEGRKHKGGNA
ncbi:MAG: endonuclease domain-containing protein [Pseudolabrys sp.]|nr:endonuclease domain-containing protein [Pseudolabrys sp.]